MAFDFRIFNKTSKNNLKEDFVEWLVRQNAIDKNLQYEKLWNYYQNPIIESRFWPDNIDIAGNGKSYRQGQEYGLPSRITGMQYSFYGGVQAGCCVAGHSRKEVVIENDIAWRIDTLVDFLFGKPFTISSKATDSDKAKEIEQIINKLFQANGGMTFFQSLALLGSVYGFVDVILRWEKFQDGQNQPGLEAAIEAVGQMYLEQIEAARALPILNENNYRQMEFYIQHYWQLHNELELSKELVRTNHRGYDSANVRQSQNVEIIGRDYWQKYQDGVLVEHGANPLGAIPVVHIQNMAVPLSYEGQSDVEPLMALQDELNTRLSDRANRVTLQSFKMYLGKGIEDFEQKVIEPGRMWSTNNPEAKIEEFGGDSNCPSESLHIEDIRQGLEKASGVSSVAGGILTGKVGNLTSAVALKVTLMGLLSKTERKRQCYGQGIKDMVSLALLALDKAGIYQTKAADREIEIQWANPLPENVIEKLQEVAMKKELGLPAEQLFKELGY